MLALVRKIELLPAIVSRWIQLCNSIRAEARSSLFLKPPSVQICRAFATSSVLQVQFRNLQPIHPRTPFTIRTLSLGSIFSRKPVLPSPTVVANISRLEAEANVYPHDASKQLVLFTALLDTKLKSSYELIVNRWEKMCEFVRGFYSEWLKFVFIVYRILLPLCFILRKPSVFISHVWFTPGNSLPSVQQFVVAKAYLLRIRSPNLQPLAHPSQRNLHLCWKRSRQLLQKRRRLLPLQPKLFPRAKKLLRM